MTEVVETIPGARLIYMARYYNKRGATLYKSGPHATRDEAAMEVFRACPKAKQVSTERGFRDDRGIFRGAGQDIRWQYRITTFSRLLEIPLTADPALPLG